MEKNEIVKGYEYSKGKYVVVDDEDLKKVAPPTATAMEILQFVKSDEVDPIYLEKSYYVAPEAAAAKPYGLLRKAMADTGYDAVAKVSMHGREHIVIIRPAEDGLVLHTMYFANELHKANRVAGAGNGKFAAKEMELAKRLIDTLASPLKPEQYEDEYRKNVERLIADKRKGREITAVEQPKPAKVVDILDALKRSLESNAKPAKAAAQKSAKRKGKVPERGYSSRLFMGEGAPSLASSLRLSATHPNEGPAPRNAPHGKPRRIGRLSGSLFTLY